MSHPVSVLSTPLCTWPMLICPAVFPIENVTCHPLCIIASRHKIAFTIGRLFLSCCNSTNKLVFAVCMDNHSFLVNGEVGTADPLLTARHTKSNGESPQNSLDRCTCRGNRVSCRSVARIWSTMLGVVVWRNGSAGWVSSVGNCHSPLEDGKKHEDVSVDISHDEGWLLLFLNE